MYFELFNLQYYIYWSIFCRFTASPVDIFSLCNVGNFNGPGNSVQVMDHIFSA